MVNYEGVGFWGIPVLIKHPPFGGNGMFGYFGVCDCEGKVRDDC